jgi:hypothetical protein
MELRDNSKDTESLYMDKSMLMGFWEPSVKITKGLARHLTGLFKGQ